jgi:uncharacterized membrane protein YjjP (DUF1212 family)
MQPVDMALEAGLLVMQNGGSTVAADRSLTNILKGYQKEGVEVIWRLDFIAATYTADGRSSTVVRRVGPIKTNLVRANEVALLGERVANGEVPIAALSAEVKRIEQLPAPYNRWVVVAAALSTAACYSQVLGGDWGSLGIASVAACVGQVLRSLLYSRDLSVGSVTLLCGVLSAMIASAGLRLGFSQAEPATLIASVIYLVPGLPLINGFVDMISQRYLVVGVERIINAAFVFLILAAALALAATVLL